MSPFQTLTANIAKKLDIQGLRHSRVERWAEFKRTGYTDQHKRRMSKPQTRIALACRKRLRGILKAKKTFRLNIDQLIGCRPIELKTHLESRFAPGMNWDNYGFTGWHIDHIIPCAAFDLTKKDEAQKCFHFTNLQPLWARDNMVKHAKVVQL